MMRHLVVNLCICLNCFSLLPTDVGSEWRTFSNDKGGEDRSRVGGPENTLLGSSDLSTMIGPGQGAASFDATGNAL